jgi:surface protein
MATVINDTNIKPLITAYFRNKNRLPKDLRNKTLNEWDVSNVTNMSDLFAGKNTFNEELNEWDVSNVTDMNGMFLGCSNFNKPLNNWNVSNVTNMSNMFKLCTNFTNFNQPLNSWNVSNVTDMGNMFQMCTNFNQELNNWNVSNVTGMNGMFVFCRNFNQPLNNWNVSNVTGMNGMFSNCRNFNKPLNNWNVSNVTGMNGMFYNCTNFNQPLNNWTLNPLVGTEDMFFGCIIEENNKPVLPQPAPPTPPAPPQVPVDATQVHKAAGKIKYPELNNFLLEKTEDPLPNNLNFPNYINDTINRIINESDEPEEIKTVQRNGLQRIMNERLNELEYNYLSPNVQNSIFNCLNYVKLQSPIFKKTYVETFIKDCVHAYEGADGMSCATGALERIVFSLLPTCAVEDNPDCETIIDLIQGKGSDIIGYIRDWYKLHKNLSSSSNDVPFPSDEDGRRANLRTYLLEKLPGQEALIDDTIENFSDHIGYEDDDFNVSFGGRRRINKRKTKKARKTMKRRISKRKTNKRKTNKRKTRKM